jgi:hypothetical protein
MQQVTNPTYASLKSNKHNPLEANKTSGYLLPIM